jgi:hypothetical protein
MGFAISENNPTVSNTAGNNWDQATSALSNNTNLQGQEAGILNTAQNTKAPTMQAASAAGGSYLPQNQALINQEMAESQGKGPSLAGEQLQQGEQAQVAQQMAVQGSQAGSNRTLGARTVADTSAGALNNLNMQQAQVRAQEQIAAQSQAGQQITNAGGQEIGLNQSNAQLQQGANTNNLQAQLQQEGLSDQEINAMLAGETGINQTSINQNMGQNQLTAQEIEQNNANAMAEQGLQAKEADSALNGASGMASAALGAVGLSDKKTKENIKESGSLMYDFLNDIASGMSISKGELASVPTKDTSTESDHASGMNLSRGEYEMLPTKDTSSIWDKASGRNLSRGEYIHDKAVSDENMKVGIAGGNGMMASFLNELDAAGGGSQHNVMSQLSGAGLPMGDINSGTRALNEYSKTPSSNPSLQDSNKKYMNASKSANPSADQLDSQVAGDVTDIGAGAGDAAAGVAALSDKDEKQEKDLDDSDVADFVNHLKAYSYRYKDDAKSSIAPDGEHTGVMAQDMQKSKVGKRFVKPNEDGHLTINYGQALNTMMATMAYLNDEVKELKSEKRK